MHTIQDQPAVSTPSRSYELAHQQVSLIKGTLTNFTPKKWHEQMPQKEALQ